MIAGSRVALFATFCILLLAHAYYPKWTFSKTEATISWDVSGYYAYLPAIFIYKDIKQCNFREEIRKQYQFTPFWGQSFVHEESGNMVMKYSCGQAINYSPFFFIAHFWALFDNRYPADGFSFPYQLILSLGSLLWAILGLIFLRKSLLNYFGETETALALLGLVLGSNYLNYAAIDGAMTHSSLFTIYSLLIYLSIQFYKCPSCAKGMGIGALIGLAALTRPTEIIACLIPLLWGVNFIDKQEMTKRLRFLVKQKHLLILAATICGLIGSLQIIYWYYVSGDFLVYSYEDQGFSWLKPHIEKGLFSFKSGWLVYSPFMFFPLIGFFPLFKTRKKLFFICSLFFLLFTYIAFAWDEWWYGASLGQRAMVQSYPILAFPLAAFVGFFSRSKLMLQVITILIALLFIYANLWFTHQAHKGGLLHGGQMTNAYFWKTLFTYEKNRDHTKLLDRVSYYYDGPTENRQLVYEDSSFQTAINKDRLWIEPVVIKVDKLPEQYDWLRVSADFSIKYKEWDRWKMTHFLVRLKHNNDVVKEQMFRVHRLLNDNEARRLYIDFKQTNDEVSSIELHFWANKTYLETKISTPRIETFDEP